MRYLKEKKESKIHLLNSKTWLLIIELTHVCRIQMLLEVRQKQRAFFKRLGDKVKELCDKRKAIEEGIFNRLIERNVII